MTRSVQREPARPQWGYSHVLAELNDIRKFGFGGHVERATFEDRSPSSRVGSGIDRGCQSQAPLIYDGDTGRAKLHVKVSQDPSQNYPIDIRFSMEACHSDGSSEVVRCQPEFTVPYSMSRPCTRVPSRCGGASSAECFLITGRYCAHPDDGLQNPWEGQGGGEREVGSGA